MSTLKINLPNTIEPTTMPQVAPKFPVTIKASAALLTTAQAMGREMRLRTYLQDEATKQAKLLRGKPAVSREQAKAAKRVVAREKHHASS